MSEKKPSRSEKRIAAIVKKGDPVKIKALRDAGLLPKEEEDDAR